MIPELSVSASVVAFVLLGNLSSIKLNEHSSVCFHLF